MSDEAKLTAIFGAERPRLRAIAARMLGSAYDADDAVQEAWLRAERAGLEGVDNPAAWLTTILSRVCLDMLRAPARSRASGDPIPDRATPTPGPEDEALAADALSAALFLVVDSLEPAQRIAFVLHDVFAVPFDEVAQILGRSVVGCRQLASRARATVRAARPTQGGGARTDREVVDAFLAAAREGDLATLVSVLDPDVTCRADAGAAALGSPSLQGADAVAWFFNGAAKTARRGVVDGAAGLFWATAGEVKVVFEFTVVGDRILAIDLLGTPDVLEGLVLEPLTSKE